MKIDLSAKVSGPLFKAGAPRVVLNSARSALQELVEEGEQRLDKLARPRAAGVYLSVAQAARGKSSTGHYRRNIGGKVAQMQGVITDGGVIYGPWLEGIGSRNMTTRFKGYHMFRQTFQQLDKIALSVLKKHIRRTMSRMGGRF